MKRVSFRQTLNAAVNKPKSVKELALDDPDLEPLWAEILGKND